MFTCHRSCVRCHVSVVTCHVSHVTIFYFFLLFLGQSVRANRWPMQSVLCSKTIVFFLFKTLTIIYGLGDMHHLLAGRLVLCVCFKTLCPTVIIWSDWPGDGGEAPKSGTGLQDHIYRQNWTGRGGMDTRGGGGSAGLVVLKAEGTWSNWLQLAKSWGGQLSTINNQSINNPVGGLKRTGTDAGPCQLTVLCRVEVEMEVEIVQFLRPNVTYLYSFIVCIVCISH